MRRFYHAARAGCNQLTGGFQKTEGVPSPSKRGAAAYGWSVWALTDHAAIVCRCPLHEAVRPDNTGLPSSSAAEVCIQQVLRTSLV